MKIHPNLVNKLLLACLSLVVCLVFILTTDPTRVPLPLIVFPFTLIGISLYQFTTVMFLLGSKGQRNKYLSKVIPLSVAFMAVGLLLLQSLHQLTWRDTLLLIGFSILLWLYIGRADFLQK